MIKIVVVGLGYVGLANAVILAQHNEVIGVDISRERADLVNKRISPIIDKELEEYLANKDLNLFATTDLNKAIIGANYVIISTPTNYDETTNFFDTSTVEAIISSVSESEPEACIVIKSTVPVGFVDYIRERLKTDAVFFSPEFLREGRALNDNLYPTRIVVGEKSKRAQLFVDLLVNGSLNPDVECLLTGTREAEAIKLFSNAYLAMRVAFFNELDTYALAEGLNALEIINGISLDPRIGAQYNNPSFGYGGYCLPKDSRQLLQNYRHIPQNIIGAIVDANSTRMDFIADEIIKLKPYNVGIYRLAMKAGSDNFRESSIMGIIGRLNSRGIPLIVYEPELNEIKIPGATILNDLIEFKKRSEIIVCNRMTCELSDVSEKVFTRDLFREN